jgi:hypothetical protein
MTTRRDISLNVIADISKYQEQFAKIPGYTDKQAAKAAQALEKRMSKAAADSARTAERAAEKAAREAAKAANKAQREIIDTQREAIEAGKGLAELAGIPADKFEKLRAVMSGLSSPLGQLAVAGVGAALAIGGVATAIAGVSAAAVASVRASGELLEKFEKLSEVEGFDIPPEDVESIRRANAALDSIQVTAERLVVIFAGQMAPSVEAVSVEIVKLGLAAGDVLDGMGSAAVLVGNIFGKLGRTVVTGIAPATGALLEMASVSASIARAAARTSPSRWSPLDSRESPSPRPTTMHGPDSSSERFGRWPKKRRKKRRARRRPRTRRRNKRTRSKPSSRRERNGTPRWTGTSLSRNKTRPSLRTLRAWSSPRWAVSPRPLKSSSPRRRLSARSDSRTLEGTISSDSKPR